VSSDSADEQELVGYIDHADTYSGQRLSFEDLFIAVTELQMIGSPASALELVRRQLRDAEKELKFPWDSNARYRQMLDLEACLRRAWRPVWAVPKFAAGGFTPSSGVKVFVYEIGEK
jgi:hypothetical protein